MTEKIASSDCFDAQNPPAPFDAAIIGAGPAGVSCAVWLAKLGFRPVVLEASGSVGGLCRGNPYADPWTVCLPPTTTGDSIAQNLSLSIHEAGVPVHTGFCVAQVIPHESGFTLYPASGTGRPVTARFVVVASGVRARGLQSPDKAAPEARAAGVQPDVRSGSAAAHILVGPGAHIVGYRFHGRRVAVLGGGDNAFENALYARSQGAAEVHVYARTVRAQQQFVQRVPVADVRHGAYVVNAAARTVNGSPYDTLMVFYGWEPVAQFADTLGLQRNSQGFLYAEPHTTETSVPGVYAIGEVTQRMHPCVVTAMADGVLAAKAIQARLEARSRIGQPLAAG